MRKSPRKPNPMQRVERQGPVQGRAGATGLKNGNRRMIDHEAEAAGQALGEILGTLPKRATETRESKQEPTEY